MLEALETPFLFVEAGAQAGAWRVLHANAPAIAALGAPALQLPAPLWEVFTAMGRTRRWGGLHLCEVSLGFIGLGFTAVGPDAQVDRAANVGGVHGGGAGLAGMTCCKGHVLAVGGVHGGAIFAGRAGCKGHAPTVTRMPLPGLGLPPCCLNIRHA